jgi:hypothetical protein
MNPGGTGSYARIGFLIVLLSGLAPHLWAQSSTTGGLKGTVTDSTGANVPGATITVVSDATNQRLTTTTDLNGSYGFSLLTPGTYRVEISAQAFKTAEMGSLAVDVSEIPVVDVTLEAGTPTEQVVCRCRVTQSATSSTGTLVDSKTITAVPLTTRNTTQVLSMSSGTAADVNNAGLLGTATPTVNVNGNTTATTYTVDGTATPKAIPNPDTISQFKIQTSQYDGVYGAHVPNTNLLTRSGSNDFHGAAWEFVRNDIFNANDFFLNAGGQPRPNLKQNQFGGTAGGPIHKDKLFVFGSYQGTRQVNGLDPTSLSSVILPPLTDDRSRKTIGSEFCPQTHGPRYSTFAGGTQVACDGSDISPVALALLQMKLPDGTYLIPTPQKILTSGRNAGLGSFTKSIPSTYNEDQYIFNFDYLLSPKDTLSGRSLTYVIHQERSLSAPYALNPGPQAVPGAPHKYLPTDDVESLKLTSTLTSNLVNEARFGFSNEHILTTTDDRGIPLAPAIGITPLNRLWNQPPEIQILGPLGTFRFLGNIVDDGAYKTRIYQWADNVSWIHGKHATRFGAHIDTQYHAQDDTGASKGKIIIQSFADFLLGLSATQNGSPLGRSNIQTIQGSAGYGPNGVLRYQYRTNYGSAFVEDDFKVSARLTLNLGLRWEYIGAPFDTAGTIGSVWPALLGQAAIPPLSGTSVGYTVGPDYNAKLINPYTGQPFGPPPSGVVTRSTKSFYENATPRDTFAPRFGFAWQPGGQQSRLSVRGGYGWFYQTPSFSGNVSNTPYLALPPFAQEFCNSDAGNGSSNLAKPFPAVTLGFVPRTPTSLLCDRVAGPTYQIPLVQQWNLNTEYRFWHSFSLSVGYVGTAGDHILIARGLNQPLPASASNPINCGFDGVATDCIMVNTSANAAQRVPFLGETPTALGQNDFIGRSWYHSLQAILSKQLSRGLTFQAAYTFSKAENNTGIYNDQNNLALDWARATFDRTHRFIANYDYEFPAFKGSKRFVGRFSKGWSTAGIVIIQSGLPMTLTDPKGGGVYGGAGVSTITLCPGQSVLNVMTSGRDQSRLNNWFNAGPTVICHAPVIGPDGSTGYGNVGPSVITGPGQFNTDFSIGKRTTVGGIREDGELAFRVEFYNTFNHPQFGNPGTTFGTATFGVVTQASVAPRLIQFGLKYLF